MQEYPEITPDIITPDTKDWTWVLERPCPECGLDTRTVAGPKIGDREGRAARMLAEDDPLFDNWDQDAAAVAGRYAEQDPTTVSAELSGSLGRYYVHDWTHHLRDVGAEAP